MSFEDLDDKELFRTAVEDFGVDVKKGAKKEIILAALAEDNVSWEDYVAMHTPEPPANVITAETVKGTAAAEPPVVRTRTEPVNVKSGDMYLIKMNRDNPYFEFKGYKFTADHPYVVMPAADADAILKREEGFTIAAPSEAAEYYG